MAAGPTVSSMRASWPRGSRAPLGASTRSARKALASRRSSSCSRTTRSKRRWPTQIWESSSPARPTRTASMTSPGWSPAHGARPVHRDADLRQYGQLFRPQVGDAGSPFQDLPGLGGEPGQAVEVRAEDRRPEVIEGLAHAGGDPDRIGPELLDDPAAHHLSGEAMPSLRWREFCNLFRVWLSSAPKTFRLHWVDCSGLARVTTPRSYIMSNTTVETHPNVLSATAVIGDSVVNRAGESLGKI